VAFVNVVGIDTSSYGFHYVGPGDKHGGFRSRGGDVERRRLESLNTARRFATELPPGCHVFVEEPLALKNGKTTRLLGLAAGAVWSGLMVDQPDLWFYWVDVAEWKKQVVGRGNAKKEEIREFVLSNPAWRASGWNQELWDIQPDLYDAWCIRAYGRRFLAR
jgi:hypothetical protein